MAVSWDNKAEESNLNGNNLGARWNWSGVNVVEARRSEQSNLDDISTSNAKQYRWCRLYCFATLQSQQRGSLTASSFIYGD